MIYSERVFEDGKLHVRRTQDVEPILDLNKRMANEPQTRAGTFRHVATIPNVILEKWIAEEGANVLTMDKDEFALFIKRRLNDPDWRYLRTSMGRI